MIRDVVYANQKSIGYGEIYVADSALEQSIPTGAGFTKVTLFGVNGQTKRCDSDHANDKITLNKNGRYFASGSFSMASDTDSVTVTGSAFLAATAQNNICFKKTFGTKTFFCTAGFAGIINVSSAPQDIDFRVTHSAGGAVNLTLAYGNLNAQFIE